MLEHVRSRYRLVPLLDALRVQTKLHGYASTALTALKRIVHARHIAAARILMVEKCSGESIEPTILSNILLRQLFSEKTDFDRGKLLARIQRG